MTKKKPNIPIKEFNQIYESWKSVKKLDVRGRMSAIRSLAFDVFNSYDKALATVEQIDIYIEIIKQAVIDRSFAQRYSRFLSKLISDKFELSGHKEPTVLSKISDKLLVESGSLLLTDLSQFNKDQLGDYSEKFLLEQINQAKYFIFGTGGDGNMNFQLRVVDGFEPLLSMKEQQFILDASETATLSIPSGVVHLADPGFITCEEHVVHQALTPGLYKVCVYVFSIPNKIESLYVVLAKSDTDFINKISKMPEFY